MRTAERYRHWRREHPWLPALTALAWAREPDHTDAIEWEERNGDLYATMERDGFTITIKVETDYDADPSFFGKIVERPEGAHPIVWEHHENHHDGRTIPNAWFVPNTSIAEHRRDLSGLGMSRGVAEEAARQSVYRDMRRLRGCYRNEDALFTIVVTVYRAGIELGGDALGGVDLGNDWGRYEQEATNIVFMHGMIDEAIRQARAAQARICAGDRGEGRT